MSIKINYSNKTISKSSANLVLFTDEKFNISNLKKFISNSEYSYISDLLKSSDLKKNMFNVNSKMQGAEGGDNDLAKVLVKYIIDRSLHATPLALQ